MYRTINRSLLILAAAMLGLALLLFALVGGSRFSARLKEEIRSEAVLTAELLERSGDISTVISTLDRASEGVRLTVIGQDGTVLYDNQADPDKMENHLDRPEVQQALREGVGESTHRSTALQKMVYYYAVRMDNGAICRIAVAEHHMMQIIGGLLLLLFFGGIVLYLLAAVLAKRLTDRIVRPLENMSEPYGQQEVYPELRPFLHRITVQNQEIKQQMERIRGQQIQLQLISEGMQEGLAVLDREGRLLSANQSGLSWLGLQHSDVGVALIESNCSVKEIRQGVFRARMGESVSKTFEMGDKIGQMFCSPVLNKGKVSGIVLLLIDFSEQQRNEQMRREFSANVSHELKTPLTSILGYAQLIGKGMAQQEDVGLFAGKIEQESNRLIALINDIIALSKLDEQQEIQEVCAVSMQQICQQVMDRLSKQAEQKKVTLSLEGEDFLVEGTPTQLEEMIYNLCDNGIKYNREGGSVILSLHKGTLMVKDTGIGLLPQDCERIFERFYRVDKSRSKTVEGTGLGLSIVKHIAKHQNARVSVQSEFGTGSCFIVEFQK